MKKMTMIVASLSLGALLWAGCGKNEAVKAAEDMADAVCKCKDLKCAQDAATAGAEKLMKFANAKGTESDAKKIVAAGEKARKCIEKLGAGN